LGAFKSQTLCVWKRRKITEEKEKNKVEKVPSGGNFTSIEDGIGVGVPNGRSPVCPKKRSGKGERCMKKGMSYQGSRRSRAL